MVFWIVYGIPALSGERERPVSTCVGVCIGSLGTDKIVNLICPQQQKIEVGAPVIGMTFVDTDVIVYWSASTIKMFHLNLVRLI